MRSSSNRGRTDGLPDPVTLEIPRPRRVLICFQEAVSQQDYRVVSGRHAVLALALAEPVLCGAVLFVVILELGVLRIGNQDASSKS